MSDTTVGKFNEKLSTAIRRQFRTQRAFVRAISAAGGGTTEAMLSALVNGWRMPSPAEAKIISGLLVLNAAYLFGKRIAASKSARK